ncbi:uncharacterized protein STEHIDRAFT_20747, partial [Stereum hirsutum FP-91666 SS1]|uniref:uncharacterized protein n=1 Tax=Stereum hirsutum (strain FP-91666) TaxID=721885 RepID=UPI000444969E
SQMVCFKCGEDDHNANRCPYGGRVCFKCKRAGHLAMECPQKQCTVCHGIGHSRDVCPTKICHVGLRRMQTICVTCLPNSTLQKCSAPGHIASECEMP